MNIICLLDLAAVAGSLLALVALFRARRKVPFRAAWFLFLFVMILTASRDLGNFVEWTGLTGWFDPIEDYLEVLAATLWVFFFYTFFQSITEKEIREIKELDEKILDGSPVAFVLHNAEMRVIRVSRAYQKVIGLPPDHVVGKTLDQFMPDGSEKKGIVGRLAKVMENGTQIGPDDIKSPFEGRYLRETILPIFDDAGKVTHTLGVLEDITERKKTMDALRESEKRYRTLFQGTHDGVALHEIQEDRRPGRFLQANETFCKMVERSKEEISGMTPLDVMESEDKAEGESQDSSFGAGHSMFFERTLITGSGRLVPCEIRSDILKVGQKSVVLSIVRDITERKEDEERIRASLTEKEILLREVHHRVKNNLQIVSGLLNLQSNNIIDPEIRAVYRESQSRIMTMALVHEKLYQSADMSRVHFDHYIRTLCKNLMVSYGVRDGRIKLEIDSSVAEMVMDTAIPCGLIINELVTNALKHAFPDGRRGRVNLSFRQIPGSQEREGTGAYKLVVKDNGVGLPQDLDIGNTKSLGLKLVGALVDQLAGTLEADSEEGACFKLLIREYHEAGTVLF